MRGRGSCTVPRKGNRVEEMPLRIGTHWLATVGVIIANRACNTGNTASASPGSPRYAAAWCAASMSPSVPMPHSGVPDQYPAQCHPIGHDGQGLVALVAIHALFPDQRLLPGPIPHHRFHIHRAEEMIPHDH